MIKNSERVNIMMIVEKVMDLDINLANNLKKRADLALENYLFLDIETTGFSSIKNSIFLIGCLYFKEDQLYLIQWLCEKEADEYELLYRFAQFIKSFKCLVHYNGHSFDIPYIKRRMKLYNIAHNIDTLKSTDIYTELKSVDRYLGFSSLKLKNIEKRYGFIRIDQLDGRHLISLYKELIKAPSSEIVSQLLYHNEDDLIGLFYCLKGLDTVELFKTLRNNNLPNREIITTQNELWLSLTMTYHSTLEHDIEILPFKIKITPLDITVNIPICDLTLNHYYLDYKHYYYLPLEDCVVHKSVGQFVDKAYRQNATRENCYIKKRGTFINVI